MTPTTEGEDESGDWHIDEFSANGDTADPASRREVLTIKYPATAGPLRRPASVRTRWLPLRLDRRRRAPRRSRRQRPEPREPAREDPPNRSAGVRSRRVHGSRRQPLHRHGGLHGRLRRDLELWAAKPLALLVRPADGGPGDRRRRLEHAGRRSTSKRAPTRARATTSAGTAARGRTQGRVRARRCAPTGWGPSPSPSSSIRTCST